MMGVHQPQVELFSYKVNLDKRARADHMSFAAPWNITFRDAPVYQCPLRAQCIVSAGSYNNK